MSGAMQAEQQGFAANERHDYAAARMHFLEAYSMSSQPQHAFSAANMCLKIGTPEALLEAKQRYQQLERIALPNKVNRATARRFNHNAAWRLLNPG